MPIPSITQRTILFKKQRPMLVEAVLGGPAGSVAPVLVHLGGGVRYELTDAGQLTLAAQLIQTLQRPC